MSTDRPKRSVSVLMWVGLLAAPLAWTVQHVIGLTLAEAACSQVGKVWSVPVDSGTAAVSVIATIVAVLGGVAAFGAFRATRDAGAEIPGARLHFLATVGMVISPIFLFIVLMSGITVVLFPECHQS